MKKLSIVALVACVAMFAVSCNNQPKEEATEPVQTEATAEQTAEPAAADSTVAAEAAPATEAPAETPAN